jgi:hypothetical protein
MTRDREPIAGETDDLLDGEPVTAEEREAARRMAGLFDDLVDGRAAIVRAETDRALLDAAAILRTAAKRELLVADVLAQGVRRKQRWRRRAPWLGVASIVAAAAIVMVLLRPPSPTTRPDGVTETAEVVPDSWRSRPADAVIGEIAEADAGKARERIDRIVADRMSGYRQLGLGRGRHGGAP